MSKVDIILTGCIYFLLGIPLIAIASKVPEVEDISNLKWDESDYNKFLNYAPDTVIATNIEPFQKLLCELLGAEVPPQIGTNTPSPEMKRCDTLVQNSKSPQFDWSDNAHKLNSLRIACLLIGIGLCVTGFFKLIQLIPQQKSLKNRTKKLNLKRKKKK